MKGIKLNKTVLALAIAATLSIGMAGCDGVGGKTDLEHVAAAKDFLDKNDTKSGVIELKSALQKNPENAEARRLLGELNLEEGNGAAAEKELNRAIELGVAKEAIILSLAKALAMQGKYQEVLDQIEAPTSLDSVDQAEIISIRGDAWLSKRKPEKAKAEFERALEIDAESGVAKLGLAKLAVANQKREEADLLITEALQSSPEDANIWLFQAELQRAKGDIDKAEESYGEAIKLDASNLMARYQRALLRIGNRDFVNAEKDVEVLKREVGKSFQRFYAEGLLAIFRKDFPTAEAALDEAVKINGNFIEAVFYRGMAHLAQNHLAQADNDLSRVYAAAPNAIKPRQLLAQVRVQEKKYQEAKELLEPLIKFNPDDPVTLNLLGNIEFALGNSDQGMEYLQKLTELKPDDASARAQLGLGLLQSGKQAKGIAQLEQAGELAPKFQQGDAFIVMAHLKSKEYLEAEKVIDRIELKHPETPLAMIFRGMLYQAKGEQIQAKKTFESVLVNFPGNPAAAHLLADMAVQNKDYGNVRKLYAAVLAKHPKHLKTKMRLAALEAAENKPKEMEAQLKEAIGEHPKALAPRLVLSRYYTRFGQAGRAQTLLGDVKGLYGNNPQLLIALYDAQIVGKNVTRALETAKQLVVSAPDSAQAHFVLASAYEANRDAGSMRIALDKALELKPGHIQARMAMVKLLTLEGKYSKAVEALATLDRDLPENLAILELKAWQALMSNKLQEAEAYYQKLFDKQPATKQVVMLARIKGARDNITEAIALLTGWIAQHPEDVVSRYLLAGFYSKADRSKAALGELEKVVALQPENIAALNDLAWILRKKEPLKALEYAEKAYGKAPKMAAVLDTLAMVLLENGQKERAVSLLEVAVNRSPSVAMYQYHLSQALYQAGQTEQAIKGLNDLLTKAPAFSLKHDVERLLNQWQSPL